jgi:transcriptional regulator with AAA-type ATPase domain
MKDAGDHQRPLVPVTESKAGPVRARHTQAPELDLVIAHVGATLDGQSRHAVSHDGLVVGREPGPGGLRIRDGRVSRAHFRVCRAGSHWEVSDMGSRNGTLVNGRRVLSTPVTAGDVIRAGATLFVIAPPCPAARRSGAPDIVGDSAAVHTVCESIERVARTAASVVIQGETGVGKELVARALHRQSGRGGAFVAVNCAAVAESLLESELFGHVRGAFTGAATDHVGLLRAADRGTLFLDEIGDMPARLQVTLLRALETRRVRPIGTWQEYPVDVRVVAATHRDLASEVQAERFRADLFGRISQWLIDVPPVRARREDVPLLVRAMLARHDQAERGVDVELADALLRADWPLNVRGLANVVATALLASGPDQPLHLAPPVVGMLESMSRLATRSRTAERGPDAASAQSLTRDALHSALDAARGNVAVAARQLGFTRQQLYRLAALHELDVIGYRRPAAVATRRAWRTHDG